MSACSDPNGIQPPPSSPPPPPPPPPSPPPPPPIDIVVSGLAPITLSHVASPTVETGGSAIDVAYVSMAPGTVRHGASVTISNRATGFTIALGMTAGGIDPVQIPAEENDPLDVVARDSAGNETASMVRARRRQPPVVVRTEPPGKKTEVPLNSAIVVVFSMPMDPSSITSQNVQLTANGQAVPAMVELAPDGFRAVVTPSNRLAANTDYRLIATTAVKDVTDESPAAPTTVEFKTGVATSYGFRLSISPATAALPVGSALQLIATLRDLYGNAVAPTFRQLEWQGGGLSASVSPTGLVRALQIGRGTITAYADSGMATAVIDVVGAPAFAVGGSWDWTEALSSTTTTCSDTGTYVFAQTGSDFIGTSQQAGRCTSSSGPVDNTHRDPVSEGRAGGVSLSFLVASSCAYEARRTVIADQLSGTVSCNSNAIGTWEAHRPWPLASVAIVGPSQGHITHGDSLWMQAELRDTAGHRVFDRPIAWASDNPGVAAVVSSADMARLIGVTPGTATISAATEGKRTSLFVTVGVAGSVRVTTTTTGSDVDSDGYLVQIDDGPANPIASNGTVTLNPVRAGGHNVTLTGPADNCTVTGANPASAVVALAETSDVIFSVTCTAAGGLRILVTSSGIDIPTAYALSVDATSQQPISANGERVIGSLGARPHTVFLAPPIHCTTSGATLRTVDVVAGITTDVSYDISCAPIGQIVFFSGDEQLVATVADGSATTSYPVKGYQPAWSPDGTRIAFTPIGGNCTGSVAQQALCLMNADGSNVTALPVSSPRLFGQSWSPDGSRIAFAGNGLSVANVDGSGDVLLTSAIGSAYPDWSPDGTKIAFSCALEAGNMDVCVINADGTGLARLTTDPAEDRRPRWSPDGSKLVFVTTRFGLDVDGNPAIAVMNADGANVSALGGGDAPEWSPDGGRISFLATVCGDICWQVIHVMRADGTLGSQIGVSGSLDDTPAWKP